MKRTALRWIAAVSALGALSLVHAARRPHYGGTLRVDTRDKLRTPEEPSQFNGQIFETLVRLDERGDPQPWLATSWSHDLDKKRWVFTPRANVTLHNGAMWSPAPITFPDDRPIETLLRDLAQPRNAIVIHTDDGSVVGTGPFRVTRWDPERGATLAAHDGYWGGRPYLDSVEIQMGRALADQALDFQLGMADVVEISAAELRRQRQRGIAVAASAPMETIALVFENGRVADAVREAVALSIDRAAIHSVLLQRQGEITGALLPQWLTGYAFLFPFDRNLARARQLGSGKTMTFGYDRQDSVIRVIAERIAVNAGEAGIVLRNGTGPADVRLVRLPVASRDPWSALEDLTPALKTSLTGANAYDAERALLDGYRIIPMFHLPRAWALAAPVRNWPRLADVWLDPRDRP